LRFKEYLDEKKRKKVDWKKSQELAKKRVAAAKKGGHFGAVARGGFVESVDEALRFETDSYMASHGKLPKGRGNWAFEVKGETVWVNDSYANAKKEIQKRYGKDKQVFSVKVLP
jgi:hypothetical protein